MENGPRSPLLSTARAAIYQRQRNSLCVMAGNSEKTQVNCTKSEDSERKRREQEKRMNAEYEVAASRTEVGKRQVGGLRTAECLPEVLLHRSWSGASCVLRRRQQIRVDLVRGHVRHTLVRKEQSQESSPARPRNPFELQLLTRNANFTNYSVRKSLRAGRRFK